MFEHNERMQEALSAEWWSLIHQLEADPHNELLWRKRHYLRYVRGGPEAVRNPDELSQQADARLLP